MNRIQKRPHIDRALQLAGPEQKLKIALALLDEAIDVLRPVAMKTERPMTATIRAVYAAKGISTAWNLDSLDDVLSLALLVRNRGYRLQSAAQLVLICTHCMETGIVSEAAQRGMLDAYIGLDAEDADLGRKFTRGRKKNSGGPVRKQIAMLLKKNPTLTNPQLWEQIARRPPRGWSVVTATKPWLDGPTAAQSMNQARFNNVCSEERKKLKS